MNSPEQSLQTQERLIYDLRLVIENAEDLLKNTDQYSGSPYQSARGKLALALQAATEELSRFEEAQLQRMLDATCTANVLHADVGGEARIMRAFD